jgi:hypothetical protein
LKLASTSLAAGALMLASTQAAMPSPAAAPLIVKATIWPNLVITFSPKAFRHGTVAIKVRNRTSQPHEFRINGVTSKNIKPDTAGLVTVTFKRRGIYSATLADCNYPSTCVGADPATGPVGNVRVT